MNRKLLVLDLDGTLTNSKKEVTQYTKDTIRKMQNQGHIVAIATGRPTPGAWPVADELNLRETGGYILSYNGGKITDCKTEEVIFEQTLSPKITKELFRLADELELCLLTYDKTGILVNKIHNEYIDIEARINKLPVKHIEDMANYIDFPVVKCLGTIDHELAPDVMKKYEEKFGDVLSVGRSEPYFIELMPKGIDKAASIERLCQKIGITRENVIACGDGFNDISMIEYAGLGVAMSNAQEVVKKAADYITASNDEDGVAKVIEKFILK